MEVAFGDVAAADLVGGDGGLFGDDAGGELLGRHFEGKEADDAAVGRLDLPVGAGPALVGPGDIEGDVGGERRLPHARAPGEDDEVGRLQAAHVAVEIGEAGRDAGKGSFALVGSRRHVDGQLQRVGEALEAAVVTAGLGDLIEAPLRLLDLLARTRIDRGVIGDVDHVLADRNEFAADGEIVDAAPVVVSVDDGGRLGRQPRQILRHADSADVVLPQESLERDRRGELAHANHRAGDLVDAAMNLLDEMLAPEKVRHAVEGVVVDQDRAEQRLFGLEIVGRRAIGALFRCGLSLRELLNGRHGLAGGPSLAEVFVERSTERLGTPR